MKDGKEVLKEEPCDPHTAEVCIKRQSTDLYVTTDQVLCFLMPVRRRKTYFTRSNAIRGE